MPGYQLNSEGREPFVAAPRNSQETTPGALVLAVRRIIRDVRGLDFEGLNRAELGNLRDLAVVADILRSVTISKIDEGKAPQ